MLPPTAGSRPDKALGFYYSSEEVDEMNTKCVSGVKGAMRGFV